MTSMRKQMEDSKAKEVGRSRPPTPIPQDEPERTSPTESNESAAQGTRVSATQHIKPSDLRRRDPKVDQGMAYTVDGKAKETASVGLVDKDGHGTIRSMPRRPLTTVYDQAVQRVQEWNEALNGERRCEELFEDTLIEASLHSKRTIIIAQEASPRSKQFREAPSQTT
jgi:hypothetical protein